MSNFIEQFKAGQRGENKGLSFGEGLSNLYRAINGVQKFRLYGICSPSKVGKSTMVNEAFVIQPYLDSLKNNIPVEWVYFSFEIDRVSMEFDFATYFLHYDYGVTHIKLPEGVQCTINGEIADEIPLSPDYLRGRIVDNDNNIIQVSEKVFTALQKVYANRIIPLFGEYSKDGYQIKKGLIDFIEDRTNPTGIYKHLMNKAGSEGDFIYQDINGYKKVIGYRPYNPNKFTIVILDHMRKLKLEPKNGVTTLKQAMDKMTEEFVDIRNLCGYSIVTIIHTNRNLASTDRIKLAKDHLYPSAEDVKDSGNIAEDCNYLITMMNPNDEKYNLTEHFGIKLRGQGGVTLYPDLRTIHLVESRHCFFPQHFAVRMLGNLKCFKKF